MAAVNIGTLDKARRIKFYRQTKDGGLVSLGFSQVIIDVDAAYYEPESFAAVRDASGTQQRGVLERIEVLPKSLALPRAVQGQDQDTTGVWLCSEA